MTAVEIIPTVGHIGQVTPREATRPDADHVSLIRNVLRRAHARAVRERDAQTGSHAAVEEAEAALTSLRHLESGRQSAD